MNETSNSDPTGDGFTISNDMALGYSPPVTNFAVNGGEIMRLSDPVVLYGLRNYYSIHSEPPSVITSADGYVDPGTPVQTPDITYGVGYNGYYFGGWIVNGVRQAGVTGAALSTATLPMTNDETAVALFFAPTDVDGLPVWYLTYWFGNTNETSNSDPTGDGFTISNDMALGYSPVITNIAANGGEILRLWGRGDLLASLLFVSSVLSESRSFR